MITIEHYLAPDGKDIYFDWFSSLGDRSAKARIAVRISRLAAGNMEIVSRWVLEYGNCALIVARVIECTTHEQAAT